MRINNENRVNLNKAILSSDEHQYENMLSTLTENIQKFETAGKKLVMTGPSQGPPPPWALTQVVPALTFDSESDVNLRGIYWTFGGDEKHYISLWWR